MPELSMTAYDWGRIDALLAVYGQSRIDHVSWDDDDDMEAAFDRVERDRELPDSIREYGWTNFTLPPPPGNEYGDWLPQASPITARLSEEQWQLIRTVLSEEPLEDDWGPRAAEIVRGISSLLPDGS